MRITNVKCQHVANPIGYRMDTPVLTWLTEGMDPSAYSVKIALDPAMTDIVYDSGKQETIDPLGFEVPMILAPRTRYFYQVTAYEEETSVCSDLFFFETGKQGEAWQAKFITCIQEKEGDKQRLPIFTKEIPVKEGLETASLYITGVGLYQAFIGEEKVGDEYMTPYCNNYREWLQVQTYDVTELLEESSKISILVGDGWYKDRFGFDFTRDPGYYGKKWSALAELHLVYEDGHEEVFGTDETWKVERSRLTFASIYDGEILDDTLSDEVAEEYATIDEDGEKRLKAVLSDRLSLPVHVMNEITPVELIHTPAGEMVLDLGQNLTGIFELKVNVPKGQKVFLQVGEILQGGNFFRDNLRSAKAEYTYISGGEETVIRPTFTFYGYRYVKVEGIPDLKKEDFTALVLHSDLDMVGTMVTGNKLINQLLSNVIWGQKGNFLDVPTDCPQRDERMGWTGDAEVFCPTATYWMDTAAFYNKYLFDMYTEQKALKGACPHVIPSFGLHDSACAWGDAATIMPWKMYQFFGDKKILKDFYPNMTAWVSYITSLEEDDHKWEKQFHFGDWLALDHPDPDQIVLGGTSTGFLAEVYYLYSTRLTKKAAAVLGKKEDEEAYAKLEASILEYIRYNYFTPSGRCSIDTQTAHLMTLVHGLSVDPSYSKEGLTRLLDCSHGKLKTGFIGTPNLCPTLTKIGETERAYDLLFNEEYPGWLYEVKNGATTIWERWNSVLEDGRLSDLTMNSLNHYAYGSIAEWIWSYAAGLEPDEEVPGFKKVLYHPNFDERMGYISASYKSPSGEWKSGWEVKGDMVSLTLTVPDGCCALVDLPEASEEVYAKMGVDPVNRLAKAGTYEVTYPMPGKKEKAVEDHSYHYDD